MPRVLQADGYVFYVYTHDHPPPHVHVRCSGLACKIAIGDAETAPELLTQGTMRRTDAGRALWIVKDCQELFLAHWRRHHGPALEPHG